MNKVILIGRLTADPDIRYTNGNNAVARYTLAVDRRFKKDGEQSADFISCITFNKAAEFAEKYLHKGSKIIVSGRIQTGSYTNKEGRKVYTTDVIVADQEFAESKRTDETNSWGPTDNKPKMERGESRVGDGFMDIPEGVEDEGLPFS